MNSPGRPSGDDPVVAKMLAAATFPTQGPLHVAVSGGADSSAALALAVATCGGDASREVTAHHVDHGLRPNGHKEAEAVRELAESWGAAFVAHQVDLVDGPNLEERCRDARRDVLPADVLLGHTADDLAETVLMRIARGTGPSGLAAMSSQSHPILHLRRSDTEALCAHLDVKVFQDPSNSDPRFTRNRIRHELMPLLADITGRDPVVPVARLSAQAQQLREFVEAEAQAIDPCSAAEIAAAPPPLARAALVSFWSRETSGLPAPDAGAMQRMLMVASQESTACDVCGGWRLERSGGRLSLTNLDVARNGGMVKNRE